jgi:hypothetical protein
MQKSHVVMVFILLAIACSLNASRPNPACKKQGLEGFVYRVSGNRMPSPNIKLPVPQGTKTTIYIFEQTNINQVDRKGQTAFYFAIRSKLVAQAVSDSSGHFSIRIPAGRYSLFTKKDTLYYANWFDKNNNIAPVEVLPGKMTKTEIRVDYDAVY